MGVGRSRIRRYGRPARDEMKGAGAETSLTGLLSRYNLQQSMLAPLSRFGSGFVCQGAGMQGWGKARQK